MFQHENILTIVGTMMYDDHLRIFMPLYMDLMKFVDEKTPSLNERLALATQVARAVKYLHDQNIFHRDIKWQNVLVCCWHTLHVQSNPVIANPATTNPGYNEGLKISQSFSYTFQIT